MRSSLLAMLSGLLIAACANVEGDAVGECSDGADNDRDGYYDCGDPDCFNAPSCEGDDDDSGSGGDDDASPDDDDTTHGDDDDSGSADDDDTTPGDDDDATAGVQLAGEVLLDIVTDLWHYEDLQCEGAVAAELDLDAATLVGSGECVGAFGWPTIKVPLEFECSLNQTSVMGAGTLFTDNATMGLVADVPLTLEGGLDVTWWVVELDVAGQGNDGMTIVTGTIAMDHPNL